MTRPAFEAAYMRVARGREHLAELRTLCADVCDDYSEKLETFYPRVLPSAAALLAQFDRQLPDQHIPPQLAILVGETTYNFRAALDYLVCALSLDDTPSMHTGRKRRNQFPIERSPKGFGFRRPTFLEGVSEAHVQAIEGFQPYSGCKWISQLAALSNRDKHNDLIVVMQGMEIRVEESEGNEPHHVTLSLHMRLEDIEGDLLGALEHIGDQVTQVLDTFSRPKRVR